MAAPLNTSDIIFPLLSTNFSSTLSELKRSTLNISNRLRSISEDADFVCAVADAHGLPLVANERCGSWYIPTDRKVGSAYFKSTDGHTGQWAFNLRRLNLNLLDVIENHKGCIIVDSTRRGKSMPDALSKTVPIWCVVLNRVLFPDHTNSHILLVPTQSVSDSERSQMEERLERFGEQLRSLKIDEQQLQSRLSKPLRPFWVTPDTLPLVDLDVTDFYPIVLCTASRRVSGAEISENGYIQGAGDDNEGWSRGLTPPLFWQNKGLLLQTSEEHLPNVIDRLLEEERQANASTSTTLISLTPWLSVSTISALDALLKEPYSHIVICADKPWVGRKLSGTQIYLRCRVGKLGSRDLRKALPQLHSLMTNRTKSPRILIASPDLKDLSIGVALSLLCLHADDDGNFTDAAATAASLNKDIIKRRLSWIMTTMSDAKPSRATLQSVNDFLLSTAAGRTNGVDGPATHRLSFGNLFSQLSGEWHMQRRITNSYQSDFAGEVSGSATFDTQQTTSEDANLEYLYSESGVFETFHGAKMDIRRRWIWRFSKHGSISVHFVKADGETEDYLYHVLTFDGVKREDQVTEVLSAHADHLCGDDIYISSYEFRIKGGGLSGLKIKHTVKGPAKDYISAATYSRMVENG